MTNSRDKGARGEREWAKVCREEGYDCRRGQQYSGIEGEDVVGLPGIHCEVKRVEAFHIHTAMGQAYRDARDNGKGNLPIVAYRRNNYPWLVVMRAEDWFKIYREWEAGHDYKGAGGMGDHGTIEDGEEDETDVDKDNPRTEILVEEEHS